MRNRLVKSGLICLAVLIAMMLQSGGANAGGQDAPYGKLTNALIRECQFGGANDTAKVYPAFQITNIGRPSFVKNFIDKDEIDSSPIYGMQFKGAIKFKAGNLSGTQYYDCFFTSTSLDKREWSRNWSGLGPTE